MQKGTGGLSSQRHDNTLCRAAGCSLCVISLFTLRDPGLPGEHFVSCLHNYYYDYLLHAVTAMVLLSPAALEAVRVLPNQTLGTKIWPDYLCQNLLTISRFAGLRHIETKRRDCVIKWTFKILFLRETKCKIVSSWPQNSHWKWSYPSVGFWWPLFRIWNARSSSPLFYSF